MCHLEILAFVSKQNVTYEVEHVMCSLIEMVF